MGKTARAIIIDNDRLLVLFRRRVKDGVERTYYAIPGGHVEKEETLEEACKRELLEELNLTIEIKRLVGTIIENNEENYYYEGEILEGTPVLGGEELEKNCYENYYEFRYLPISELDSSGIRSLDLVKKVINHE